MKRRRIPGRTRARATQAVVRRCAACGRLFACVPRSVADECGVCRRCFERNLRFPGLCQRP